MFERATAIQQRSMVTSENEKKSNDYVCLRKVIALLLVFLGSCSQITLAFKMFYQTEVNLSTYEINYRYGVEATVFCRFIQPLFYVYKVKAPLKAISKA